MRNARIIPLFILSLGLALPACAAGRKSSSTDSLEEDQRSNQGVKPPQPTASPQSQVQTPPIPKVATPKPVELLATGPSQSTHPSVKQSPNPSLSPSPVPSAQTKASPTPTGKPEAANLSPTLVNQPSSKLPGPSSVRSVVNVKPQPTLRPSPQPTVGVTKLRGSGASNLPDELIAIEALYKESGTVTANFTQVSRSAATGIEKTTFGKIQIKQPNKVRWETTDPDPSLLVSDGKKFWFYTPPFDASDGGQVIIKKASQVQSRLAHALIAGAFSQSSVSREVRFEKRSNYQFLLIPKPGRAGTVKSALIEIHPKDKRINKVILDHRDGNHAEILLQKIELGTPLQDSVFQFVPPKGTIVIDPDRE
jgi:outer membrane lipoprotein carrier protein